MDRRDVAGQQQGNMAEAAVESPTTRFFCHRCSQEISPVLPDFTCPRCEGGFIEEVGGQQTETNEESPEDDVNTSNSPAPIHDLWQFLNVMRRLDDLPHHPGGTQEPREARNSRPGPSRRIRYNRPPRARTISGPSLDPEISRFRTEGFITHLVNQLSENAGLISNTTFPVFLNLHANPGDYAWGRGSWNAIITQLINQLDGTGPPPLPKDKIEEIPTVKISQEQVDKNLQCTVCMEDYVKGETVRMLTCEHYFHNGCIIPWLELHGTCPICRKLLNSDHNNQENNHPDMDPLVEPVVNSTNVYDFRDEYD